MRTLLEIILSFLIWDLMTENFMTGELIIIQNNKFVAYQNLYYCFKLFLRRILTVLSTLA